MTFLFPWFLFALAALAIPILIHLFNLRKYKKITFPSIRFLKEYVSQNKRMSQIQKKWLMICRLLLLLFLVIAFAQPIFKNNSSLTGQSSQIIYIDNSRSMDYKMSERSLLDLAKENAVQFVQESRADQFIILDNDRLYQGITSNKEEAIRIIQSIEISPLSVSYKNLQSAIDMMTSTNPNFNYNLFLFSDFQQNLWTDQSTQRPNNQIDYYLQPVRISNQIPQNVYIDTAFLTEKPQANGQAATLITRIAQTDTSKTSEVLFNVKINNQNRGNKKLIVKNTHVWDTTNIILSSGQWNALHLHIDHRNAIFDNDYYITARNDISTDVLVLNQGSINGYLISGFSAHNNIMPLQQNGFIIPDNSRTYALIVFQGITSLDTKLAEEILALLNDGQSILFVFDKNANISNINIGLQKVAPIQILKVDTTLQQIVALQSEHPLLKGVLSHVPDNVQLPISQYGYKLKTGITSGRQDVMKYRDDAPFITQFNIGQGKLYFIATPLDLSSTNLVTSYFFAPLLYKMAINNSSQSVFAAASNGSSTVWLPHKLNDDRDLIELVQKNIRIKPKQLPRGSGTEVVIPDYISNPGFYHLLYNKQKDSTLIGINNPRIESKLLPANKDQLLTTFGKNHTFYVLDTQQMIDDSNNETHFPLWKIAILLVIVFFLIESYILTKSGSNTKQIPTIQ